MQYIFIQAMTKTKKKHTLLKIILKKWLKGKLPSKMLCTISFTRIEYCI